MSNVLQILEVRLAQKRCGIHPHRLFAMLLAALVLGQSALADSAADLHRLFDDYFAWQKAESPRLAMSVGDYSNADKLRDESLDAIEGRHKQRITFMERLKTIDRAALDSEDQLSYDLFDWEVGNDIEGHQFRTFLAPIGARSGPHQDIGELHERVPFNTPEDYANYLERLGQTPKMVKNYIVRLHRGANEGRLPARITVVDVPGQIDVLLGEGLSELRKPLENFPDSIDAELRESISVKFDEELIPAIRTALISLRDLLDEEYIPECRSTIAAADWPDGEAYYAYRLKVMTTTDMTAKEIHELGLKEVARIRAEMMEVIRESDFFEHVPEAREAPDDALFQRFLAYLREDPRFYYDKPEDLLNGYRAICKRIDAELPRLFGVLPRIPYGVREISAFMAPNQTTAYYQYGSMENAQPGWFYANTYALDQRPKYEMMALALHEAVPGHHLQIAIAQELQDVPEFRKRMWITAYGEGWGLYAERLGVETNLYDTPYDDFGRLIYEMWRACRLVVDPGMHALGWSRQQAIDFMLENTALSELNIRNEVDRYIAWPAQATAYKIGELKIRELRKYAEDKLGERFDVRAFHDQVLGSGCLPLTVLEKKIHGWVEGRLAGDHTAGF